MNSSPPQHHIAMWGPPGSGKTTFLASLSLALLNSGAPWNIIGEDDRSVAFLADHTTALSGSGHFPEATKGIERYQWSLSRTAEPEPRVNGRRTPSEVSLTLLDPAGGGFGDKPFEADVDPQELMLNLARSRGIIFLYDPIREYDSGDSFEHLYRIMSKLAHTLRTTNELVGGRLPHHVAFCVTKFDDLRVFSTAQRLRLLRADPGHPHGFPRIEDDEGVRRLLSELALVSASRTAELVVRSLDQYFHADRVRFFASSSIGFYVDPIRNAVDWDDPQNLKPDPDSGGKRSVVRGPVFPINVIEPVLWLMERIFAGQRERGT